MSENDSSMISGPDPRPDPDTAQPMDRSDRGQNPPAGFAQSRPGPAALINWEELSEDELFAVEADPVLAPRLERLRAVEAYLRRGLDERPCPTSEELYDLGGGPGARPMEEVLRAELEDHVLHCAECSQLVKTLEQAPPSPLVLDGPESPAEAAGPFAEIEQAPIMDLVPANPARRAHWVPVAAAAAVLIGGYGLLKETTTSNASQWPQHVLLRQSAPADLWFPRGPVIHGGLALEEGTPTFEFAVVPGAERYSIFLERNSGDALGTDEERIEELVGQNNRLAGTVSLEPGHYTWRLWARVNGLDQEIGALDFEVVAGGPELDASAPALDRVVRLHEAGFLSDARALAATMPHEIGRQSYLEPPGR